MAIRRKADNRKFANPSLRNILWIKYHRYIDSAGAAKYICQAEVEYVDESGNPTTLNGRASYSIVVDDMDLSDARLGRITPNRVVNRLLDAGDLEDDGS